MENKLKVREIYNEYKQHTYKKIERVIESENFPLEFILYYEDTYIRTLLAKESINLCNFLLNNNNKSCGLDRRLHKIMSVINMIIKDNSTKILIGREVNVNTIKQNIKIIDENIEDLLNYYDIYIAKNALEAGRYEIEINNKKLEFISKEYNKTINLQGFYEKNNVFQYSEGLDLSEHIGKPSNRECINKIFRWFTENLETLNLTDRIGNYTVEEFLKVWSCIIFICETTATMKKVKVHSDLKRELDMKADDIESALECVLNFVGESTEGKDDTFTFINVLTILSAIDYIKSLTDTGEETIKNILEDLIYSNCNAEYSIVDYPILRYGDTLVFSTFCILYGYNVEILMKKKGELLYKKIYNIEHNNKIEPRICDKIRDVLSLNNNFEVFCISETINNEDTREQSQIDVLIYDKFKRDIMIIEVKDHISKIDYIDVTNQVKFEMNSIRNGIVKQLTLQQKLIKLQYNLNKFLPNIKSEDINSIYLGYCETFYLGTPRFIEELKNRNVAYIPYKLLLKNYKHNSVKKLYYYFLENRYVKTNIKYSHYVEKIECLGYEIIIPKFEHK